ncbi:MAG: hypothetical protein KID00_14950 [Clostridium argentinense]|uniref:DUF6773 family protein n=1 Tax=Clostridium butanoliproducens TaxID=2991837 RepID=UPI001E109B66|nr:DUF6773 family protein [Clostridium butanoliproducens]MBS5825120.1 hypothetical protein [Clostridium argentinense]MDU1350211.1 DUF6773 family protein [Clostridium argentinense]
MNNKDIKEEEKNISEIANYEMHTIFILVIGLFLDVAYKFFILQKPFYEFAISFFTLFIGMLYISIKLWGNGIIMKNKNINKIKKIKLLLLRESVIIGVFITIITYAVAKDGFKILYPQDLRISFVLTFILESFFVTVISYFIKLLIGKVFKKTVE